MTTFVVTRPGMIEFEPTSHDVIHVINTLDFIVSNTRAFPASDGTRKTMQELAAALALATELSNRPKEGEHRPPRDE